MLLMNARALQRLPQATPEFITVYPAHPTHLKVFSHQGDTLFSSLSQTYKP
jgi:hypothetical protein